GGRTALRPGGHPRRGPGRRHRDPGRPRRPHARGHVRRAHEPEAAMKTLTLTEAKLLLREPLALLWGLAMPMVLLAVMGGSASSIGGVPLVTVYEPIVIAFISVVFGVQGIPVQV